MTTAQAQEKLDLWQDRLDNCTLQELDSGKTKQVNWTPEQCLKMVRYYEGEVSRLTAGRGRGARVMRCIPRDF